MWSIFKTVVLFVAKTIIGKVITRFFFKNK